ncbi:MAG: 3-oxoadipate enol-lactonase [Xanthomonadales bacterium]|nr:3-oxoadipate enol-lactonase [Xanthomonadales bacterium]
MALLELASHRLHYRIDGDRDSDRPWLTLCNSLGTDLSMWDAQADALSADFRVLRYDRRGHGQSSAPPAPYTLADLGGDVLALLDHLGIQRTHFCGLSIGGLVGQWLGIHSGERLGKLVVCATDARIGSAESWQARSAQVRAEGLAPLAQVTAQRWFTPAFIGARPEIVEDILARFVATSVEGYCGCCEVLAGADLRADLARIANPLLAISGDDDPVCTPADLEAIAQGVADGRHLSLPGRHIVNIESADAFSAALVAFLR